MINQTLVSIVGFVTALAVLTTGIVIITGLLLPTNVPMSSRMLIGSVMIGYGVYRSIMLWMKHRSQKHQIGHDEQAEQ